MRALLGTRALRGTRALPEMREIDEKREKRGESAILDEQAEEGGGGIEDWQLGGHDFEDM